MSTSSPPRSNQQKSQRPLSPHLQIYRPSWTMVMSIIHRLTGAALYAGTLLLTLWLVSLASGPKFYESVQVIFSSWLGQLILFGYTWALIHHMLGGIRHLIMDFGKGYGPHIRIRLAQWTLTGSIFLTLLVWSFVWL